VPVLGQVLERYPKDVKFVFKNFPLNSHRFAMKAAAAALAAGSQGKFWEFHDRLFENYNRINDQKIREIALSLNLDEVELEKKMTDPEIQKRIRQDIFDGRQAGVNSTPSVFINGKLLRNRSLAGFQAAIEKELQVIGDKTVKPNS
jgi:protein-disulfide isomerase